MKAEHAMLGPPNRVRFSGPNEAAWAVQQILADRHA